MCLRKKPVSPKNPSSLWDVWSSGQSSTAATLSGFNVIPVAETVTPPNMALDWNNLHSVGASDNPFSQHLLKNFSSFASFLPKSSSAIPISSIQVTRSSSIISSSAVVSISQKVV